MKNKIPAFFIFIIILVSNPVAGYSLGQNSKIDSIEISLKNSAGAEKIPYYYALTDYYIYNTTDRAIELANEFLILAEKLDSVSIIEYCYEILGEAYFYQEDYNTALSYFKRFLNLQRQQQDERGIARGYNNLGIIYRALQHYDEAVLCYKKSLEINQKLNDSAGISNNYNNLGVLHEKLNLFGQARDFYQKSLEIELENNHPDGISTSYLNLGGINFKLRNYNKAIEYCQKSIEISDSLNFTHTLEVNYEVLYQTYKKLGNSSKALFYHEEFHKLKNKRINKETSTRIAEIELKYQNNKKEQEIELLQKQKKQKSRLNYIGLAILLLFAILLIILFSFNNIRRKKNKILQTKNAEVLLQKEEIEAQRDEIEAQRDEIQRQKELSESQTEQIKKQNQDIKDSIEYAKHIQIALFPDKITLQKVLKDGFCLFKPKDIVSGDFYWVAQVENKSIIVAADCTGHGVPGAFMSIIGINFLNEIIFDEEIIQPNLILNELRKKIIKTLVNANRIEKSKDGMDVALIVIDYDQMKLEYAGAYNHLYYIRDHMLNSIKADRMPVGLSDKAIAPFTNHTLDIQKDDIFYMFTDGYADQFGGPNRKKFRVGNLRELLLDIHEKEMVDQKRALFETFINWKDNQPQVDDVLSIGIKI